MLKKLFYIIVCSLTDWNYMLTYIMKLYVNTCIAVSILFTVPHVIVLYTRTITSACCMHTLMFTTSRSFIVDTDIHSMSSIIVSWWLITASTHKDKCLLNVKLISLIAHANVQSRIVVLSSHRSMASAIPNSLCNDHSLLTIQHFTNIHSWLMYGSVLCLSK